MKIPSLLTLMLLGVLVLAGFRADTTGHDNPVLKPQSNADVMTWTIDKVHSKIGFKVKHLGISTVRGDFNDYEATLRFDPADLSTLTANTTVQVASIDTENERRDNHLRSPDFFAAEEHPTLIFVSKGVRNIKGNTFELVGDLTMRGTTKEVVLDAEFLGTAGDRAAFEAETTVNRMDYGLAWDKLTEAGGLVVSKEVTIVLELEVKQQKTTEP